MNAHVGTPCEQQRFSYRRLTREPDACRAEILAAYRRRLGVVR